MTMKLKFTALLILSLSISQTYAEQYNYSSINSLCYNNAVQVDFNSNAVANNASTINRQNALNLSLTNKEKNIDTRCQVNGLPQITINPFVIAKTFIF